ncbi:MAG: hypothetical protein H0X64_13025 [Gemmatimonadaceae bacterium]|nr:hypothetical protein [Gemmatimonadaceae bacterium]
MPATFRPLLAAAALTAAFTACSDPNAIEAQFAIVTDTFAVFSINDAPSGAPTAISLFASVNGVPAVTAGPTFSFDFAVDAQGTGSVTLIPNSRVGNAMVRPHRVGLQVVPGTFDALTRAPASGYKYDSLLVITPGQVVAVQAFDPFACPVAFLGTSIYGKLVVDSVRTGPTRVFFRSTVDPNCDFRSLLPGVPKD